MSKKKLETVVAFDKESQRSIDVQGFMHVVDCSISKAVVNPYFGYEIPKWKEHGLEPKKVYYVLRDPSELAKAAPTFNNLPLLDGHVEVGASSLDDPEVQRHVVGSTGTDAVFDAPYLKNSLVIWTGAAQDDVVSRTKTELSCGYRYDFVPESGVYAGVAYDGRMTNIVGNHVALVETGRAGRDVVVADHATVSHEEEAFVNRTITSPGQIVRGALLAFLTPRLATDAAIAPGEMIGVMKSIAPGDYADQVPALIAAVGSHFADRLAADASVDGLEAVLNALPVEFAFDAEEEDEEDTTAGEGGEGEGSTDDAAKVCKDCGSKKLATDGKCEDCAAKAKQTHDELPSQVFQVLSGYAIAEPDLARIGALLNHLPNPSIAGDSAMTDTKKPEDNKTPEAPALTMDAVNAAIAEGVKVALDAAMPALRESVKGDIASRYAAAKAVEPHIGNVDPLAADSAEAIYKLALDAASVPTEGVDPSSYRAMVGMLKAPGTETKTETPSVTTDAESVKSFNERYPHAKNIGRS